MRGKKCPVSRHFASAPDSVKRWGQYELVNPAAIRKIIDALEIKPDDTVLEIGAGTGVITLPIKEKAARVVAVEIDRTLCLFLENNGIEVINKDFLRIDLTPFSREVKIVSNLPYYITTPIVTKIIHRFDLIVLTMQDEVARRLTAGPGGKEYGAISVFTQFYTNPEIIAFVPRRSFRPVPKVDSCVVRFKAVKRKIDFPEEFFFKVVRAGFISRRKMLKNNLAPLGRLDGIKIDLSKRAEELSVRDFCVLAGELWKRQPE